MADAPSEIYKRKSSNDVNDDLPKRPYIDDESEEDLNFQFNTEDDQKGEDFPDDSSSSESDIGENTAKTDTSDDEDDNDIDEEEENDDESSDNIVSSSERESTSNIESVVKQGDVDSDKEFVDDNELVFAEDQICNSDNEIETLVVPQTKDKSPNKKGKASKKSKTTGKSKKKKKRKDPNMRKNIRNVFKGKELDTMTQQLREKEQDRLKRLGLLAPSEPLSLTENKQLTSKSKLSASSAKEKEVIFLDSSSEDEAPSNSACKTTHEVFVLSSDSSDDEDTHQHEDLIANHHSELGLHTNDIFNTPDGNGQVLINVQRKDNEECLYLSKRLSGFLKPHQIGGVRFLYDNLIESLLDFHPNVGNGCILAHSMGLGKTIQTVTFVDFFLRNTPAKKVLCVVPVNTIQNWVGEFNRWVPPKPSPPLPSSTTDGATSQELNVQKMTMWQAPSSEAEDFASVQELLEDMIEFVDFNVARDKQKIKSQVYMPQCKNELPLDTCASTDVKPVVSFDSIIAGDSTTIISAEIKNKNENPSPTLKEKSNRTQNKSSLKKETLDENCGTPDMLEDCDYRPYEVFLIDTQKQWPDRIQTIDEWNANGGVLLIGYEMYRLVSNGLKTKKFRGKKGKLLLEENRDIGKAMKQAVCDPGPDLVVCDEGHRIRNYQSGISQSLKSIVTRKRLVLTGYPIQNNLIEYWCMVDFVRPNYLGTRQEFANMFERPILNGQCVDSTQADKRLMRQRAHVLYSLLQGFVQRRDHSVFASILPKKEEHVIMVRLSPLQKELYQRLIELTKEAYNDSLNPIKTFHLCCKIWNHPDILYKALQECQQGKEMDLLSDEDDISLDADSSAKQKRKKTTTTGQKTEQPQSTFSGLNWILEPRETLMDITQWAPSIFKSFPFTPGDLKNSGKFDILNKIIHQSVEADDKILIFSQSLLTLSAIEEMLQKSPLPQDPSKCWKKGEHYFRLDGSTTSVERERQIKSFNDKNNKAVRLFLLSTRAGCLGINLVAANRVVVFDVSWNPCHDAQAVCRIYRYGQTKPCHIYRFVASNTMEKKMYYRQISKQGISNRVVDEMNQTENFSKNEIQSLIIEEWVDEPSVDMETFIRKHSDHVLQNVLRTSSEWISQVPFKHESLLINDTETEVLTGSEKRAAKRAYEVEKKMCQNRPYPLQPSFPRNTPVAPVKPFLWRPPSLPNISSRISFPVMVSNHTSVSNTNNAHSNSAILSEYASMLARLTSTEPRLSMATTTANQTPPTATTTTEDSSELSALLSTVRHSLSSTNVITANQPPVLGTSAPFILPPALSTTNSMGGISSFSDMSIPQLFRPELPHHNIISPSSYMNTLFTPHPTQHFANPTDAYSDIHGTYLWSAAHQAAVGKVSGELPPSPRTDNNIIVLEDSDDEE